jgi:membrane protease YdiL (CAAX protease family)
VKTLEFRGINYDAGVIYEGSYNSRPTWRLDDVRRDLRVIRDDLSCNAVSIMATDTRRLAEAGEIAAALDLFVWLQPRLFDVSGDKVSANLRLAAIAAEALRASHPRVGLNVGCELTLSSRGMLPGDSFVRRGHLLPWFYWLKPVYDRRLNSLLASLTCIGREHFGGPLTYGAGDWESVDWEPFDYVGLDTYRDSSNARRYADDLSRHVSRGKPVLVVEFGCCSFEGAAERGPNGFEVLNWRTSPPTVPNGVVRNEQVQADYISRSLDAFESTGVHGSFLWGFSEPTLTHSTEPSEDLDIGSFGIVKVLPPDPGSSDPCEQWEPKAGFHTLAARYRQIADEPELGLSRPAAVAPHSRSPLALSSRLGIVFAAATIAMIMLTSLPRLVFGVPPGEYDRTAHALRAVLTTLVLAGIALAACRWLDRRPVSELGIATGGTWRKVALGAAAWLVPAALAYAACAALGLVRIDLVVDPAVLLTVVVTQLLLVLLLEALPEELVFRGYFFVNLSERLGQWSTILAQAALFALWALLIGAANDPGRFAMLFAVGFGLGYLRSVTGSIWPCVGFHLAFQTTAQLLSGTQVPIATVHNLAALEVLAYGILPFAVGVPLVAYLIPARIVPRVSA